MNSRLDRRMIVGTSLMSLGIEISLVWVEEFPRTGVISSILIGREIHDVATPTLLCHRSFCHKEPASSGLGFPLVGSLLHKKLVRMLECWNGGYISRRGIVLVFKPERSRSLMSCWATKEGRTERRSFSCLSFSCWVRYLVSRERRVSRKAFLWALSVRYLV